MKLTLFITIFLFFIPHLWAGKLDSLLTVYHSSKDEGVKSATAVELSTFYKYTNLDSSYYYAEVSVGHAKKTGDNLHMANSLNSLGNAHNSKGHLGIALTLFLEALEFAGKANNNNKLARINNNIGIVYYNQGDKEKALDHFQQTASMLISEGDTLGAVFAFNNIGGIYDDQKKHAESLAYFERGYKLAVMLQNDLAISVLLTGVATAHAAMGETDLAILEHIEALQIKRKMGNKASMIHSLSSIAEIYYLDEMYREAIRYYEELAILAQEIGHLDRLADCYLGLTKANAAIGNYQMAYEYLKDGTSLKDSLKLIAENETITEIQTKYEKAQDQKKIQLLEKNEQLRRAEIERKELWNVLLIGGGVMVLGMVFFVYNRLRLSKNQNRIIQQQKALVDEKNKEVFDSINYAKHIQQAMLSAEDTEGQQLPEHFILFKPKDIVSGDFYWTHKKKNHFYIAAVDCTGHGVPGAFLTLLGSAFMNEIVSREEDIPPATILEELRKRIIKELGQGDAGSNSKDGMDISLIKINPNSLKAEWSGANNPLWILKNNTEEIKEIKGDKEHIGYSYSMSSFTNHEIQFEKGDQFYLFSDGFQDQFGIASDGKEKKFKAKQLKQHLVKVKNKSSIEQKTALEVAFEKWKGELEQLDDVCFIGMRL